MLDANTSSCKRSIIKLGQIREIMKKSCLLVLFLSIVFLSWGQIHNGGGTKTGSMAFYILINNEDVKDINLTDWSFFLYFSDANQHKTVQGNIDMMLGLGMPAETVMGMLGPQLVQNDISIGNVDANGNSTPDIESAFYDVGGLYLQINFADWGGAADPDGSKYSLDLRLRNSVLGIDTTIQYKVNEYVVDGTFQETISVECESCGPPSLKPVLAVNDVAFCWVADESYDLEERVESVSEGATVKFYSDQDCKNELSSSVVAMDGNPTSSKDERVYWAKAIDDSGESDAQKITVTVYQKPEVTLTVEGDAEVCANTPITLKTTGNSNNFGASAYRYYANTLDNNGVLHQDGTGNSFRLENGIGATTTCFVEVTTVNGCKGTASVEVGVTPVIAADDIKITGDKTTICEGECVELSVSLNNKNKYSGTIAYEWSTGETGESITVEPKATTTYNVYATLNGCTSSTSGASQIVTVNPLPTFSPVNPDPVCSNVSETVNITQSGTDNDYKYYSNEGATNAVSDPTKVAAGDYWVTLTENGCVSKPQKVTATVNLSPNPTILVDNATPKNSLCSGTEIILTASGADGCSYAWSKDAGGTAAQAKVTLKEGANNFELTVMNTTNKCSGTAQAVAITGLKLPTVTIAEVKDACAGSEITLEATPTWSTSDGAKGEWTKGGEKLTTTESSGKLMATAQLSALENTYTINLTDGNGCTATKDVEVMGNVLRLDPLSVSPMTVKVGDQVLVQASASWNNSSISGAGYDRTWTRIAAGAETKLTSTDVNLYDKPNVDRTYYKLVAEKDGCRDSITSDTLTVSTDPFGFPGGDSRNAIASVDDRFNVCSGDDLSTNPVKWYVKVEGGSESYTYTWKYPSSVTATAKDDTLTITAIDYENFGNNQTISVEISDGTDKLEAEQAFSVRPIPQIKINGANNGAVVQACKAVALNLTAAVDGINSGLKFSWSTGSSNATIAASTSATGTTAYRVTATYDGCSNTDSVKVQVNDLPKVSLVAQVGGESVDSVCPGAEITLVGAVEGVSSPTFRWMNGASSLSGAQPTIAVASRTNYGVEYTDATTTCKSDASVTVEVYPKVKLELKNDVDTWTVCPGMEVKLTVENGDAETYAWKSLVKEGETDVEHTLDVKGDSHAVTPDRRTVYTVNGKDKHGCEADPATATLDVRQAPTLVLAKSKLPGCKGGSVDISSATQGLSSDYTLVVEDETGKKLEGTSVTADGTYTIYVNGGGDCSSNKETVEVEFHALPTVILTVNKEAICSGELVTLEAKGTGVGTLTYSLNQNGFAANSTWTNSPSASTSYTVEVKDGDGCQASGSASVTVKPRPELAIVDPGVVCAGAEVTLEASGEADAYEWKGGVADGTEATYKVKPTETGKTFSLQVTKDGCLGSKVEITLNIQAAPVLQRNSNTMSVCVGEPIDLQDAFDPNGYKLTFFDKDKKVLSETTIGALSAGDTLFYAKATSAQGGCESEDVLVRVTPKPLPQFTVSGLAAICQGEETVLTAKGDANNRYAWAPAGKDGATSGAEMTVNPTRNTEYSVTATGSNQCKAEQKYSLTVHELPKLDWEKSDDALIVGNTGEWSISATAGKAPYTYEWKHNGVVDENYTDTVYTLTGVEDVEVLAVKVKDANGCSDSLEMNITVTDPNKLTLGIETDLAEGEELCIGNVAHLQVTTEGGKLTKDAKYQWSPSTGLDADTVANPVFTAETAGRQTYTVVVTEQGKTYEATVSLPVKDAEAPVFEWDPTNPESFAMNESFIMKIRPRNATQAPYTYTWLKPGNSVNLPQYSIQTATQSSYEFAVVVADANGCRTTDTLTTRISIGGNNIEIKTETELTSCAVGTLALSVEITSGADQVSDYRWEGIENTLTLKDADSPNATLELDGVDAARYQFRITVIDKMNNEVSQDVFVNVVTGPTIQLAETCVALHKDSLFVLNVVNPGDNSYLWQESLYGTDWGNLTDKGRGSELEVKMGDQDMRYIVTVKDEESKCEASDTAMIYRIPDAPTVEIDTNTTHLDIKLAWGSVNGNDGYTIWSRKWDPYCLTDADGGVYAEAGSTTRREWAPSQMDTLEFFYVTADKNVCGQTYYSATSDTLGYYLMDVKRNETAGKTSLEWYPLYFDMRDQGIVTSEDFMAKNLDVLSLMAVWEYEKQEWSAATIYYDPKEDDPETTDPIEFYNVFDLPYGSIVRIGMAKDGQLLQYGKLPEPIQFNVQGTATGTTRFSNVFVQPFRLDLAKSSDMILDLDMQVSTVVIWNFASQEFDASTIFYDPKEDDPDSTDPIEFYNEFDLRTLMPIRVANRVGSDINWK